MNLNVTDWKPFRIDSFFDIYTGGDLIMGEIEDGDIPIASNSAENNNIAAYTSIIPNRKLFDHTKSISIADRGKFWAFIQGKDFYLATRVKGLVCKDENILNQYQMAFIVSIINQESFKFSYGRNCCANLPSMEIYLPIQHNADGTPFIDDTKKYSDDGYVPDWQFMENYIKSLHHKPLTTKNKSGQAPDLNVQDWDEFCLGELFDVSKAYAYNQETFEPIEDVTVNKIGCITRTANNNGLDYYGELTSDLKIETGNALTIGGEGVVCFYQPEQFVCGTNMTVLRHKNLNKYNGLFISRVIDYYSKDRFSYGRAFNKGQVEKSIIKLPVDINGNPDWQFMEDYIKALPYGDRLEG